MKAHGALFILLTLALLAAAQTGAAQSTPSYRPPPSSPQYRPPAQPPASAPAPATSTTPPATSPASPASAQPASPSSVNTPMRIQSVWIQNSPGVPDLGGHCIICGLIEGNLTAVEPNLMICVTPTGRTGASRACTDICPPGHDCKKPLGEDGVVLLGTSKAVHVEVLDNDKKGKTQKLAAFDESDATQCTTAQPCKVDDADDQAAGTLVSFEFGVNGCTVPASSSGLTTSTMTVSGSLPTVTSTSAAQVTPSVATSAQPCNGPETNLACIDGLLGGNSLVFSYTEKTRTFDAGNVGVFTALTASQSAGLAARVESEGLAYSLRETLNKR